MDGEDEREVLSRRYLIEDRLREMVLRCSPGSVMLTADERAASLRAALAAQPERGAGAWLFCYGSLVWNPTVRADAQRVATVAGWRRAFCLATRAGRGDADNPGLVLGLLPGGCCQGVALHLPQDAMETELELLWRREMITGAYIPAWLEATDGEGRAIGPALAFTINPAHENYVDWPEEKVVAALATASGELGSSADYLFRTREGLRSRGIADPAIERLASAVERAQAAT